VPKTIDNDLSATDVTFGYHTAVSIVTEALDRLHSTAESHRRAIVVEVMGRDAGWIALESGVAGSADVILIPEIPFRIDKVCTSISRRSESGSRFSIVVVAEGAVPAGGEQVMQKKADENLGVARLGGIAQHVAAELEHCLDMETRVVVLGHVQRGGTPSHTDRLLGTRFGVKAMELVASGQWQQMVSLRGTRVVSVPIEDAIGKLNLVDPEGELVLAAEGLGISMGR
jgi:6-phosphofructokinase 1